MRRMQANWSDLSPAEVRGLGIEFAGRRRGSARRLRRLRAQQAKIAASSAAAPADGPAGAPAGAGGGASAPAANGRDPVAGVTRGRGSPAAERRRDMRVRVDGRAYIRSAHSTISAGLVDLSEGGVRFVLPEAALALPPGAALDGPVVLEADVKTSRICLDVAGQISWHRSAGADTHFGVAFGELAEGEIEGVQRFIAAACSRRGNR